MNSSDWLDHEIQITDDPALKEQIQRYKVVENALMGSYLHCITEQGYRWDMDRPGGGGQGVLELFMRDLHEYADFSGALDFELAVQFSK
jgi:hypothetical protein